MAASILTVVGVVPIFQVAAGDGDVSTGQARYDTARYDTAPDATYSGLDAQWTDDSCDVIEAQTVYGRQRSLDVFDVGTATVTVINPDGMWDYPPTPTTPLTIRPGRQARVGVNVDGAGPVWLWHGWIDGTQPSYTPDGRPTVTVNCVCAKGEFGRVELPQLPADVGAGETITARMHRLADAAVFPAHRRQFAPTGSTLIGSRLSGRAGQLADQAAQGGGGDVYGDQRGYLTYRNRDWQARDAATPVDAAIGNRGVPGEICPNGWEVLFNRSDFASRVNYGRPGEAPAVINDLQNQGRYGVETWNMTSQQTADNAELHLLADRALRVRNFDRAPRVAACTVDAARPGVVALLVAADPFKPSAYTCALVESGRQVFVRNMFLTGVEHTITPTKWTARLALDDAAPWIVSPETRYDTAHYDTDRYSYGL